MPCNVAGRLKIGIIRLSVKRKKNKRKKLKKNYCLKNLPSRKLNDGKNNCVLWRTQLSENVLIGYFGGQRSMAMKGVYGRERVRIRQKSKREKCQNKHEVWVYSHRECEKKCMVRGEERERDSQIERGGHQNDNTVSKAHPRSPRRARKKCGRGNEKLKVARKESKVQGRVFGLNIYVEGDIVEKRKESGLTVKPDCPCFYLKTMSRKGVVWWRGSIGGEESSMGWWGDKLWVGGFVVSGGCGGWLLRMFWRG